MKKSVKKAPAKQEEKIQIDPGKKYMIQGKSLININAMLQELPIKQKSIADSIYNQINVEEVK